MCQKTRDSRAGLDAHNGTMKVPAEALRPHYIHERGPILVARLDFIFGELQTVTGAVSYN